MFILALLLSWFMYLHCNVWNHDSVVFYITSLPRCWCHFCCAQMHVQSWPRVLRRETSELSDKKTLECCQAGYPGYCTDLWTQSQNLLPEIIKCYNWHASTQYSKILRNIQLNIYCGYRFASFHQGQSMNGHVSLTHCQVSTIPWCKPAMYSLKLKKI